jgi:hypothetical protein
MTRIKAAAMALATACLLAGFSATASQQVPRADLSICQKLQAVNFLFGPFPAHSGEIAALARKFVDA